MTQLGHMTLSQAPVVRFRLFSLSRWEVALLCLLGPNNPHFTANNPHFTEGSIKLVAFFFLLHRVTEARGEQLVDLAVKVHL